MLNVLISYILLDVFLGWIYGRGALPLKAAECTRRGYPRRAKATINSAKRQRPREKIRSRTPSADVKPSLDGGKENAEEKSSTLGRNRTASDSNEKAARQIETRDEERENSSPECERRVYEKTQIPEEGHPQRKDVQKTDNLQESKGTEVDYVAEKDAINDLPEIIDESDR